MSSRRYRAVIPAAGLGKRLGGDTPKQYQQVNGRSLLEHSLAALLAREDIATVVVALHPDDQFGPTIPLLQDPRVISVVGGAERSDSVLAALDALSNLADDREWVLVHDAARPCLSQADLAALIRAVTDTGVGALLAAPVVDTVKRVGDDGRKVQETLDRGQLWRAQTPQMFPLGELRRALRAAADAGVSVTDEAAAMERQGVSVQVVPGSSSNIKVTVDEDLPLARFYLEGSLTEQQSPSAAPDSGQE